MAYVEAASRTLARYLRPGSTVILEFASFTGATQAQVLTCWKRGPGWRGGHDFRLAYGLESITRAARGVLTAPGPDRASRPYVTGTRPADSRRLVVGNESAARR